MVQRRRNPSACCALILVNLVVILFSRPWLPGICATQVQLPPLRSQQVFVYRSTPVSTYKITNGIRVSGAKSCGAIEGNGVRTTPPMGDFSEVFMPQPSAPNDQKIRCQQLQAMWMLSRRRSRAVEVTNEIPTYSDPFQDNDWETYYPTTQSRIGLRITPRYHDRTHFPVFGRIVSREPILTRLPFRPHYITDVAKNFFSSPAVNLSIYGFEPKGFKTGDTAYQRSHMQYRLAGGGGGGRGYGHHPTSVKVNANSPSVQGSFQKLKKLIWTERARELTQQRRVEELVARAIVLKEIANGQSIVSRSNLNYPMSSETPIMDKDLNPLRKSYQQSLDDRLSISGTRIMHRHQTLSGSRLSVGDVHSLSSDRTYKRAIFSVNPPSKSKRTARLLLPSINNCYHIRVREGGRGKGSRRDCIETFESFLPVRSSYFRERNRPLFEDMLTNIHDEEQFRRYQRNREDVTELRSVLKERKDLGGRMPNNSPNLELSEERTNIMRIVKDYVIPLFHQQLLLGPQLFGATIHTDVRWEEGGNLNKAECEKTRTAFLTIH